MCYIFGMENIQAGNAPAVTNQQQQQLITTETSQDKTSATIPSTVQPAVQSTTPTEVKIRTAIDDPQTIEKLFFHVANGGDLITFCKMLDIPFSAISGWITADPKRHKRFSDAAQMGMEWIKNRILNEIKSIGISDRREILNDDGTLKPISDWPDDVARALETIEVEELYSGRGENRENIGQVKKVKLTPKLQALELVGKETGMFIQRTKVEVTTKLEDLVAGSFDDDNH